MGAEFLNGASVIGTPRKGAVMELTIEVPKIKKAVREEVFAHGFQRRIITKVYFRDGTFLTFSGELTRKEIVFNGYFQKCQDLGMTEQEAALFAGKGKVEPLKEAN
jgi:hypothetical protein